MYFKRLFCISNNSKLADNDKNVHKVSHLILIEGWRKGRKVWRPKHLDS